MLLYVDSRFASPYALSACVALHEKGLTFEMVPVDLAAQAQLEPHFTHISLTRRIPTLVHEDFSRPNHPQSRNTWMKFFPVRPCTLKNLSLVHRPDKFRLGSEAV